MAFKLRNPFTAKLVDKASPELMEQEALDDQDTGGDNGGPAAEANVRLKGRMKVTDVTIERDAAPGDLDGDAPADVAQYRESDFAFRQTAGPVGGSGGDGERSVAVDDGLWAAAPAGADNGGPAAEAKVVLGGRKTSEESNGVAAGDVDGDGTVAATRMKSTEAKVILGGIKTSQESNGVAAGDVDGDGSTATVAENATGGLKDTLQTQVRTANGGGGDTGGAGIAVSDAGMPHDKPAPTTKREGEPGDSSDDDEPGQTVINTSHSNIKNLSATAPGGGDTGAAGIAVSDAGMPNDKPAPKTKREGEPGDSSDDDEPGQAVINTSHSNIKNLSATAPGGGDTQDDNGVTDDATAAAGGGGGPAEVVNLNSSKSGLYRAGAGDGDDDDFHAPAPPDGPGPAAMATINTTKSNTFRQQDPGSEGDSPAPPDNPEPNAANNLNFSKSNVNRAGPGSDGDGLSGGEATSKSTVQDFEKNTISGSAAVDSASIESGKVEWPDVEMFKKQDEKEVEAQAAGEDAPGIVINMPPTGDEAASLMATGKSMSGMDSETEVIETEVDDPAAMEKGTVKWFNEQRTGDDSPAPPDNPEPNAANNLNFVKSNVNRAAGPGSEDDSAALPDGPGPAAEATINTTKSNTFRQQDPGSEGNSPAPPDNPEPNAANNLNFSKAGVNRTIDPASGAGVGAGDPASAAKTSYDQKTNVKARTTDSDDDGVSDGEPAGGVTVRGSGSTPLAATLKSTNSNGSERMAGGDNDDLDSDAADLDAGRLSTNMTIERQTPKRDFGDRMEAGVETEEPANLEVSNRMGGKIALGGRKESDDETMGKAGPPDDDGVSDGEAASGVTVRGWDPDKKESVSAGLDTSDRLTTKEPAKIEVPDHTKASDASAGKGADKGADRSIPENSVAADDASGADQAVVPLFGEQSPTPKGGHLRDRPVGESGDGGLPPGMQEAGEDYQAKTTTAQAGGGSDGIAIPDEQPVLPDYDSDGIAMDEEARAGRAKFSHIVLKSHEDARDQRLADPGEEDPPAPAINNAHSNIKNRQAAGPDSEADGLADPPGAAMNPVDDDPAAMKTGTVKFFNEQRTAGDDAGEEYNGHSMLGASDRTTGGDGEAIARHGPSAVNVKLARSGGGGDSDGDGGGMAAAKAAPEKSHGEARDQRVATDPGDDDSDGEAAAGVRLTTKEPTKLEVPNRVSEGDGGGSEPSLATTVKSTKSSNTSDRSGSGTDPDNDGGAAEAAINNTKSNLKTAPADSGGNEDQPSLATTTKSTHSNSSDRIGVNDTDGKELGASDRMKAGLETAGGMRDTAAESDAARVGNPTGSENLGDIPGVAGTPGTGDSAMFNPKEYTVTAANPEETGPIRIDNTPARAEVRGIDKKDIRFEDSPDPEDACLNGLPPGTPVEGTDIAARQKLWHAAAFRESADPSPVQFEDSVAVSEEDDAPGIAVSDDGGAQRVAGEQKKWLTSNFRQQDPDGAPGSPSGVAAQDASDADGIAIPDEEGMERKSGSVIMHDRAGQEAARTGPDSADDAAGIAASDAGSGGPAAAAGGQKKWLVSNFRQQDDEDDGPSTLLDLSGSPDGDGAIAVADLDGDSLPDVAALDMDMDMDNDNDAEAMDLENAMVDS
ncbi:MAG: hypothetical protein ACR2HN_04340 [Tepidiformaceae bacterium]